MANSRKYNSQRLMFSGAGAGSDIDLGTLIALQQVQAKEVFKREPTIQKQVRSSRTIRTINSCLVARAKAKAMKLLNIVAIDQATQRAIYQYNNDTFEEGMLT